MAGGMTSGRRETLAERVANTRAREAGHGVAPERPVEHPAPREPPAPPVRHCWYDGPHGRQAALLLGWRQVEGRYSGRIVVAAPEPDGWAVVEMWVDQGMLSPAGT
ncbi:hypothetical protein HN031_10010 [Nocardioides sp. zg-1308]|jgi:hypothetical protein|uniref:hypothetical protein n=1 Tax=Nocardioides TaxID=1839 RepID=UPI001553A4FB|nr:MULTISPECIES: hypothetical protein [unclassified Nocardioides]NPD05015.1 hypothetical protein [Nocardioides sp. zg-1308]WQQ22904.1 hypothetical protein SHK17_02750 [Nocardioides sp. S-34]